MTRRQYLANRLAKRTEWAQKAEARSEQKFTQVHELADSIPFGQPILVGHHSERHARRDAERIFDGMGKAVELSKLAEHHTQAASGLAGGILVTGQEYVSVTFADKPEREIIDRLKVAGYYWSGGSWHGKRESLPDLS